MRRGRLALDPQLLQERLGFALKVSSTVGADGADLDAYGGDVFRDEFAMLFHSVTFMLEEANELEAGNVVHAQHRVPVAAERSHMKGTCDVDEESLRALISTAFGRFWHGVTSHPGFRALRTWAPHSRQRDTRYKRRSARDLLAWVAENYMELHDVIGFALAVTIDRAVITGIFVYFISARRRALISTRPVSGRRERKMSILRPKRVEYGGGWEDVLLKEGCGALVWGREQRGQELARALLLLR